MKYKVNVYDELTGSSISFNTTAEHLNSQLELVDEDDNLELLAVVELS